MSPSLASQADIINVGAADKNEVNKHLGNTLMANHKSAQKRARQTIKRNELNRSRRSAIRTAVKQAESAAASGDAKASVTAQRAAESVLARGTLHWKTAARKTSRLAKRAKAAKKS
jgi:small subunit ribosomal protein S20